MGQVTYFQRYTSQENSVTNTTLHLLSQINQHSSDLLKTLLGNLLGDKEMPLGVTFQQQVRSGSVPDAIILQEPIHIVIETKVTAGVGHNQLINHLGSFTKGIAGNYLVLLTKVPVDEKSLLPVHRAAKAAGVVFHATTFEQICNELSGLGKEHETHLVRIIKDYESYCSDMDLLPDRRKWLRIVPCRDTFNLNARHGVYYHSSGRGYSPFSYLGLYTQKAVRRIGVVTAVYDSETLDEGPLQLTLVDGNDTPQFRERIEGMIIDSETQNGWCHLRSGHRFFCVDRFYETYFEKKSWGGIQGPRFWDISGVADKAKDLQEIAGALKNEHWE
ncbi:MAG: hypothetical protein EOP85_07400 [Verrucomicrobiaceae bacterium]|nr:MAG: hypothetical protein EOP85_07400 [Verrucomicrobiaceae bacterium]